MPTLYYAIEDGNFTPKKYVKTLDKVAGTYTNTTVANDVRDYSSQTTAQTDSDYCDVHFGERFHVVPSPKTH